MYRAGRFVNFELRDAGFFPRLAKLNEKKSDRELQRERKTKETNMFGRKTEKLYSDGEKMRNASGQQGENEQR